MLIIRWKYIYPHQILRDSEEYTEIIIIQVNNYIHYICHQFQKKRKTSKTFVKIVYPFDLFSFNPKGFFGLVKWVGKSFLGLPGPLRIFKGLPPLEWGNRRGEAKPSYGTAGNKTKINYNINKLMIKINNVNNSQ